GGRSGTASIHSSPPEGHAITRSENGSKDGRPESLDAAGLPSEHVSSSSQRVTIKGKTVVKSSDTEETDGDSDSSLEDLNVLLAQHQGKIKKREEERAAREILNRYPTNPASAGTRNETRPQKRKGYEIPPTKSYKFSLQTLVAESRKGQASEEKVARARAALGQRKSEDVKMEDASKSVIAPEEAEVDEGLLASVAGDPEREGGVQKVLHAMKRTEALSREKAWNFFSEENQTPISRLPFPENAVSRDTWQGVFVDPRKRSNAIQSGYEIHALSLREELPYELVIWMLDELCVEDRPVLRDELYMTLVERPGPVKDYLTPPVIAQLFARLNARKDAIESTAIVKLHPSKLQHKRPPEREWGNLCAVINLLGDLAPELQHVSREYAIELLCRLLIASDTSKSYSVIVAVEDALSALITSPPASDWQEREKVIIDNLTATILDPRHRLDLASRLPAHPPRLHTFRRALAFAFLTNLVQPDSSPNPHSPQLPTSSSSLLTTLTSYLDTSPLFSITPQTSYPILTAASTLLDIVLADGYAPPATTPKPSPAELEFNNQIDLLAAQIKRVFSTIVDTGASYMHRTEAKECLERLYYRCVFAVRMRPMRKKGLFDGTHAADGGTDREEGFMRRFLAQGKSSSSSIQENATNVE
ncbi:MAG: hypothetical protein M1824_003578, partial [Vezdaea acicularis]